MVYERRVERVCGVDLELHEAGEGPPLLYLHDELGLRTDLPFFAELCRSFRVIAPSHPGFGTSSLPAWMDRPDDFSYVYIALIARLNLSGLTIAGASLGAWVATEIAIRNAAPIRNMFLLGPVGMKLGPRDRLDFPDLFASSPERLETLYCADTSKTRLDLSAMPDSDLEIIARNRETFALIAWEPYLHNPKLARLAGMVDRPVMVLRGADDLISSKAYAGEFARTFSRGVFVQISSAGHLAHYDNPNGVLTALTRFCAPGR